MMSKGKTIALWIVTILLTAMFLFSGSMKLLHPDQAKPMFVKYGYAAWFATFIGACEVLGALGLLIQRLAALAAAGLAIIMAGAVYTHWSHAEYSHGCIPLVLMVMLVGICITRMQQGKQITGGTR
jgi:putative oxidoreductase